VASPGYARSIDNSRIDHNRWYDPSVGKWLSEDPSGLAAGANPYRYCDNGPTDATDPSGMDWTTWGAALLGHDLAGDAAAVQANLAAGNERAAAAAAVTVYGDIIWGTQETGSYPLALALMKNWYYGGPKSLFRLSDDQTMGALTDRSGPIQAIEVEVQRLLLNRRGQSGNLYFSKFNVSARSGDYHYALGDYRVGFTGKYCKKADGKTSLTGIWIVTDYYHWTAGATANLHGIIIQDNWAILVQKYYVSKPFNVWGGWYGTIDFPSGTASPAPTPR